jgi:cytochrome c-type biogenesis protein
VDALPLALAAGLLAAVNPCGFALLPAYLSLLVTGDGSASRATAAGRALILTAAMTTGFAVLFGGFGLLLGPVTSALVPLLPWFSVALGLVLLAAGAWLLAGRSLPTLRVGARRGRPVTRAVPSMVLFGAAYALASLGCTIGPFLAVVVSSLRSGRALESAALFLAYAAGMGLVVGTAALAVALARVSVVDRIRRFGAVASRASGVLLLASGAYVAYHGWFELRILRGATGHDPLVSAGDAVQRWLAGSLDAAGAGAVAVAFLVLVLAFAVTGRWRRSP